VIVGRSADGDDGWCCISMYGKVSACTWVDDVRAWVVMSDCFMIGVEREVSVVEMFVSEKDGGLCEIFGGG
jgi:hypothetical protein